MTGDGMDVLRERVRADLSKYGPDVLLPKIDDTVMDSVRRQLNTLTHERDAQRMSHQRADLWLSGYSGGGKVYLWWHALTVLSMAGCTITGGEDDHFVGVTAPEGMSEEAFRDLTYRAWYW